MQPTDHSSNKNIIEKETFFFFFFLFSYCWWNKSHRIFKTPYTETLQAFSWWTLPSVWKCKLEIHFVSTMGKSQSGGIEALWSMQKFTSWKQNWSDITYVPRIKHPLGNEQFYPLKIQERAEGILWKSNIVVKMEKMLVPSIGMKL